AREGITGGHGAQKFAEVLDARLDRAVGGAEDDLEQAGVPEQEAEVGHGCVEPSSVAVPGVLPARAQSEEPAEPAGERWPVVVATLDALEVRPHPLAAPALVAGRLGDVVPILGRTGNGNHGVVDRAAPHALSPRVEQPRLILRMRDLRARRRLV